MGGTASRELDLDSGACGKRKRGEIEDIPETDSGGGEIAEIDSGGGSEEKETREVMEFEDRYGILDPYQRRMRFEDEDFVVGDYISTDEDGEEEELEGIPYDRKAILQYISQVRNSFGFDVDTSLPSWLKRGSVLYFTPIRLSCPGPGDIDYVNKAANIAIHQINLDMKNKTSFELVEVAKAVITYAPFDLLFLTLAVKKVEEAEATTIQAIVYHPICEPWELYQWRVKPDVAEA